jgi:ribosome-binding factor A
MKSYRPARVAEVIREVAAETILFRLQDPRIRGVTVTRVEVPTDLQTAKIYISVMGSPAEADQCLEGLHRSAGFIQRQLADRLKLRYTPALSFRLDRGQQNSAAVSRLLHEEAVAAGGLASPDGSEPSSPPSEPGEDAPGEPADDRNAGGAPADRLAREQN